MRDAAGWSPTKYVASARGGLAASSDPRQVNVASRLITTLVAQAYAAHAPAYCHGRLGDLGCGRVPLYGLYKDRVSEVVCVDWPSSAHASRHIDVQADLASGLPFATASFDTVILSDVLEHISEPSALLGEIRRCLRPRGHLIASVPYMYWLHETPHDYFRYTEHGLRHLLQKADLEVVQLEPLGGSLDVITDLAAKSVTRWRWIGRPLAAFVQSLAMALAMTPPGRRHRRRTARQTPLEYFFVAQTRT